MRPPVYAQLCDAITLASWWSELDMMGPRDPQGKLTGAPSFQLRVRRPSDGHVVAASRFLAGPELAAGGLVREMLMSVDPEQRAVVADLDL